MIIQKFLENAALLNIVSHNVVASAVIKICAGYKYIGFFF